MDIFSRLMKKKSNTPEQEAKQVKFNIRTKRRQEDSVRVRKIKDNLAEGKKLKAEALKKKLEKTHAKKLLRDEFRKAKGKTNGVNWKRIRIANWKLKEYTIK